MTARLRISEIFHSLQGEAATSGRPTTFVRLTGCPLRCGYCDTSYAFNGGALFSIVDVMAQVANFPTRYVTVTGGEPLAQTECVTLLQALVDEGYQVSLETSGALPISDIDARVSIVMDLKTPGSGEVSRNLYSNIEELKPIDQVKFVICSRADYEWARFKVDEYSLSERVCEVLFSPVYNVQPAKELAEWILSDGLDVRLQIQLHKLLWGDIAGV
jgi:7-carboxy-7-deazaguanine synthase